MALATGVGLVALMLPAFAGAANADSPYTWQGNGWPNTSCSTDSNSLPGTMLWIWTGDGPTSLTINGEAQTGSWAQQGGGAWHFTATIDTVNYPPTTTNTFMTYTGSAGTLTLSGCNEGGAPPPTLPTIITTVCGQITFDVIQQEAAGWYAVITQGGTPVATFGPLNAGGGSDNMKLFGVGTFTVQYYLGDPTASGIAQGAPYDFTVAACPANTGTITFVKVISGGTAVPGDFTLLYVGPTALTSGKAKSGDVKTLPFGAYVVGENLTNGPANYTLDSVDCVPNGQITTLVTAETDGVSLSSLQPNWTCTITNVYTPPDTYCVSVTKTDANGDSLVATFAITEPASSAWQTLTFTTPHAAICGLSAGTYVFTETTPPSGYTGAAPQTVTLPVDTDTGNASLTFIDTPIVVPPVPSVSTTCGGTVAFSGAVPGWTLTVDSTTVGVVGSSGSVGPLGEGLGAHTYSFTLNDTTMASGTFSIGACSAYVGPPVTIVTATPTATPTASPNATPTPTATPGGGVLGTTSAPSLPPTTDIPGQGGGPTGTILLLLGALGAASLALITTTLLRERLWDRNDR